MHCKVVIKCLSCTRDISHVLAYTDCKRLAKQKGHRKRANDYLVLPTEDSAGMAESSALRNNHSSDKAQ